ncbi:hypothetical protein ACKAV7_014081 [Fusarium commune]
MTIHERSSSSMTARTILRGPDDWISWIQEIELQAEAYGAWPRIDPERADRDSDKPEEPVIEDFEIYQKRKLTEHEIKVGKTVEGEIPPTKPSTSDLKIFYEAYLSALPHLQRQHRQRATEYSRIMAHITESVDSSILTTVLSQVKEDHPKGYTIRQLLRGLKEDLAPSISTTIREITQRYLKILDDASKARQSPEQWLQRWQEAYAQARPYEIPEILGNPGVNRFLEAVEKRIAPSWAESERNALLKKEKANEETSLTELASELRAVIRRTPVGRGYAVHATLGNRSDKPKKHVNCPCKRENHWWKAEDCALLIYAVTGTAPRHVKKPSDGELDRIRKELEKPFWKWLKPKVLRNSGKASSPAQGNPGSSAYPGNLINFILSPYILAEAERNIQLHTAHKGPLHPLTRSTLLDTCGATHLVNSIALLEKNSFIPTYGDYVEAGDTSFPILGKGTRVIHKIVNGPSGTKTQSLTLSDVVVVEGFHTNIVSEALLRTSGAWYSGFDCSLRWGSPQESVVLIQLQRKYNVLVLQFKPVSAYSPIDRPMLEGVIPISNEVVLWRDSASVMQFFASRAWRSSRDTRKPRDDHESLWHLRAGHLGKEALQKLVKHARNVRINGIARINCETCARTYATQVISRRPSDERSPRPFWRIHWDLQEYEPGYNGSRYLLVIKDEYSGWLYAIPLANKNGSVVFNALFQFERWVKRQFGLVICKIRSDNEPAVIHASGNTDFLRWVRFEGLEVELAPPHTKESNGGSERAGKEVSEKSNVMLNGAQLPHSLWPESTQTSAFLLNISPKATRGWLSPIEVLQNWFRREAPLQIREHTADLRPDWSGVYAYGCRAYPLDRDREAGTHRKAFKTSPRGHIGYLVGYTAHNIYRIWIPRLEKVVVTRNIRFNKHIFYEPTKERSEELPEQVFKTWILNLEEDDDEIDLPERPIQVNTSEDLNSGVEVTEAQQSNADPQQSATKHQNQHAPIQVTYGLQTPEETPEPTRGPDPEGDDRSIADTYATSESFATAEASESPSAQLQTELEALGGAEEAPQSPGSPLQAPLTPTGDTIVVAGDHDEEDIPPSPLQESDNDEYTDRSTTRNPLIEHLVAKRTRARQNVSEAQQSTATGGRVTRSQSRKAFQGFFMIDHHKELWKPDESAKTAFFMFTSALCAHWHARRAFRIGVYATLATMKPDDKRHRDNLPEPPRTYNERQNHPLSELFSIAEHQEVAKLRLKRTWRQIQRSMARSKILPLKWVYTYKFDKNGYLDKCKARICVRGDLQDTATIESTYAATLAARSFRLVMALAARFDLEIVQLDITNAFVNAERSEHGIPVTCELPPGFKVAGMYIKLDRALYGLRDSPQLWFKTFTAALKKLGLEASKEEPCLYYSPERDAFLVFFVDDILILYHRDTPTTAL